MASCVKNIRTENCQHLIIGFQVTVENVGEAFWDTLYGAGDILIKRKHINSVIISLRVDFSCWKHFDVTPVRITCWKTQRIRMIVER